MNFSDTCASCLYKIYNQLAIHDAPVFILDLFLPILTTATWRETLLREMKDAKTYDTIDELLDDLHEYRKGMILTSEKITYTFNNANSNSVSYVTFNFDCTSNNATWDYGLTDSSDHDC